MIPDTTISNLNQFVDAYGDTVTRIAKAVAKTTPGIDGEDVEQEIWVDLLQPGKIAKIEKQGLGPDYLERVMWRAGEQYAKNERLAYVYNTAQWVYTPKEIRALLEEAFFNPEFWEKAPEKDEGVTITAKGIVVCLWDLLNALHAVSVEDRQVVVKRYASDDTLTSAEAKRLERAIDKITQRINTNQPHRATVIL